MSEITKLGYLYLNNIKVPYPATKNDIQSYTSGLLEIRDTSTDTTGMLEWIPFSYNGINYLVGTNNVLKQVSYSDLLTQGLVLGNKTVILSNTVYKIRILSQNEWNNFIVNQGNFTQSVIPNTTDKTVNGYTDTTVLLSDSNNLWHWYGISSLTSTVSGDNITVMGNTSVSTSTTISKTTKNTNTGWRIVLEKYNSKPTLSGNSESIGYYTRSFTRDCYIYDEDNELLDVTTYIDDTVLNTYTDKTTGTNIVVNLASVFDSLSYGQHVIKIVVTDRYGQSASRVWTFQKIISENGSSSNLGKPTIITPNNSGILTPINAQNSNTISFSTSGGLLIYKNEIYITNSATLEVVYNTIVTSFDLSNTIPANVLTNGEEYQIKIRTYDSNGNYSAFSDAVIVSTYSPIELAITNIIDNRIITSNPIFTGTFAQADGDTLLSYQFILYKNGVTVEEGTVNTDKLLVQQFNNLENKTDYSISLIVKTENGVEATLTQDFYCIYLQTRLSSIMNVKNDPKEGMINIETYIKQIIGYVASGNTEVTYIDGEWADLHNSLVRYDSTSPFRLENDFTMKIWARDFEDNVMIMRIYQDLGHIELTKQGNYFFISKYINDELFYQKHAYIKGDISTTDEFYIFIQCEISTGLLNFDVQRTSGGIITWFNSTHTGDIIPTYNKEDGFLTNLNSDLVKLITPVTIDGLASKVYIPSQDELFGENCLNYFNTNAIVGQAITGRTVVGRNYYTDASDLAQNTPYFTRTISTPDTTQLVTVNTDGTFSTSYPNDLTIGERFIINLPNDVQVSKSVDNNGYHQLVPNKTDFIHFDTINVNQLVLGDKIKEYGTKYDDSVIEFMVVDKNKITNNVTLMTNVIMTKEYDNAEDTYENGNPNWGLSNICQWLNNEYKLADE
jgi:hypothetical protein